MKRLYICLTDFQILNAISMQYAGNDTIEADIMLVTNKEGNYELAKRLQSTGFLKMLFYSIIPEYREFICIYVMLQKGKNTLL